MIRSSARCRLLALLLLAALGGALILPRQGESFAPAPLGPGKKLTNSIGMKLVRIPAGKFMMGSRKGEKDRRNNEDPRHEVEITRPFFLGVYEVTQEQYKKVIGTNPSYHSATGGGRQGVKGMDTRSFPVENVSWAETVTFCTKLTALARERAAGRKYRLPTEAEWEYACRAGAKTYNPFAFGKTLSSRQANFNGNSPWGDSPRGPNLGRPTKVGSYKPNGWGLYDMHGNVWEYVADWYDEGYYKVSPRKDPRGPLRGTYHPIRGGSYYNDGSWMRSATRGWHAVRNYGIGFRVVCEARSGS
jgi:formylglycine-generating enzyme required for sulfatase activity